MGDFDILVSTYGGTPTNTMNINTIASLAAKNQRTSSATLEGCESFALDFPNVGYIADPTDVRLSLINISQRLSDSTKPTSSTTASNPTYGTSPATPSNTYESGLSVASIMRLDKNKKSSGHRSDRNGRGSGSGSSSPYSQSNGRNSGSSSPYSQSPNSQMSPLDSRASSASSLLSQASSSSTTNSYSYLDDEELISSLPMTAFQSIEHFLACFRLEVLKQIMRHEALCRFYTERLEESMGYMKMDLDTQIERQELVSMRIDVQVRLGDLRMRYDKVRLEQFRRRTLRSLATVDTEYPPLSPVAEGTEPTAEQEAEEAQEKTKKKKLKRRRSVLARTIQLLKDKFGQSKGDDVVKVAG